MKRGDTLDKDAPRQSPKNSSSSSTKSHGGRIPPQSIEIEEAVLGALMLEKEALSKVVDLLTPEIFYKEAHQEIMRVMISLFAKREPVDILVLSDMLKKEGLLEKVGGNAYLAVLTESVSSSAHLETHTRILMELYMRREIIRISSDMQKDSYAHKDVFDVLDEYEKQLFDITARNIRKDFSHVQESVQHAMQELAEKKSNKDVLTGLPSGFRALDEISAGWQKSDLVIVAGRPGMGKTAFSLSMLRNLALDFDKPCAMFSLEMSTIQLVNRLLSMEAEIEGDLIRKGKLEDTQWELLVKKASNLNRAPIYIDDTPALSVMELRAKARRLQAKHKIQLLTVDYLQLMVPAENKRFNYSNREQEIGAISRSLKGLAKELKIPVIANAQLSRAVEVRGGEKRPILSDLRESGSIEQDADLVVFLYRPSYYGIMKNEDGESTRGMVEVNIAKHRNGPTGTIQLRFLEHYTKFVEYEDAASSRGAYSSDKTFPSKLNTKGDKATPF